MGYCSSCGSSRDDHARFCPVCGAKAPDSVSGSVPAFKSTMSKGPAASGYTPRTSEAPRYDKFCVGCGSGLIATAVVCPRCGTGAPTKGTSGSYGGPQRKDKTIALILAIFTGHFTWLYTYERDQQKFWIGLGIWLMGFLLLFFLVGIFAWLGIWIWAIVDVVQRSEEWYANYE